MKLRLFLLLICICFALGMVGIASAWCNDGECFDEPEVDIRLAAAELEARMNPLGVIAGSDFLEIKEITLPIGGSGGDNSFVSLSTAENSENSILSNSDIWLKFTEIRDRITDIMAEIKKIVDNKDYNTLVKEVDKLVTETEELLTLMNAVRDAVASIAIDSLYELWKDYGDDQKNAMLAILFPHSEDLRNEMMSLLNGNGDTNRGELVELLLKGDIEALSNTDEYAKESGLKTILDILLGAQNAVQDMEKVLAALFKAGYTLTLKDLDLATNDEVNSQVVPIEGEGLITDDGSSSALAQDVQNGGQDAISSEVQTSDPLRGVSDQSSVHGGGNTQENGMIQIGQDFVSGEKNGFETFQAMRILTDARMNQGQQSGSRDLLGGNQKVQPDIDCSNSGNPNC